MTKNEIKAIVAAKIEGQGTNVDAGSVLPAILDAIIDGDAAKLEVDDFEEFSEATAYSSGDIVRKDGKLYKFTANKSAGAWDSTKATQTNVFSILSGMIDTLSADVKTLEDLHIPCEVTISALEDATLTAEQAAAAGFTAEVLAFLKSAHSPIVEFSDLCVTFNVAESVSEGVVNQSALIVRSSSGTVTAYTAVLTLNADGSVGYAVDDLS